MMKKVMAVLFFCGVSSLSMHAADSITKAVQKAYLDAAEHGLLADLQIAIDRYGVDINTATENGETALHMAAYGGRLDVVRYLIEERGFEVDVPVSRYQATPLFLALRGAEKDYHLSQERINEYVDVMLYLLNQGANWDRIAGGKHSSERIRYHMMRSRYQEIRAINLVKEK